MNQHPRAASIRLLLALCAALWATPPLHATAAASEAAWVAEARGQRGEHLGLLGVGRWHAAGHRGKGVKVAVLDSGFRGWRSHLGKGLPDDVRARSFRVDGDLEARDSQHGILCGEVVHALAPEAEILFANWEPGRPDRFLAAVRWAKEQGARVITCSVIMPDWSDGEGGGEVHAALARLLDGGAGGPGVLCFASAGNTARRHWGGAFRAGAGGCHEWKPGVVDNPVTPWGEESVAVALSFGPGAEYEALVYEGAGGEPVARSRSAHGGALARFKPKAGRSYRVRVRLVRGKAGPFHCVTTHGELGLADTKGSVCFPADGAAVVAVGAATRDGRRQPYSSCGPNSPRPKPDVVAAVPFVSLWRERPFGGTSAASPQAAALAALWWSRYPDQDARQVRGAMTASTRPLSKDGHSPETGYGLIRLP